LFAVAIGLVVLYVTCLTALVVRLPASIHLRACVATSSAGGHESEAQPRYVTLHAFTQADEWLPTLDHIRRTIGEYTRSKKWVLQKPRRSIGR
jgi:hypothetical protein